mgnify:CR=1 FL=1
MQTSKKSHSPTTVLILSKHGTKQSWVKGTFFSFGLFVIMVFWSFFKVFRFQRKVNFIQTCCFCFIIKNDVLLIQLVLRGNIIFTTYTYTFIQLEN